MARAECERCRRSRALKPEFPIARAEARHESGLAELFGSNGYGCYCRYWHFAGTSREWLARCFSSPEQNRAEFSASLAAQSPDALGLVAENPRTEGPSVVGWLKLSPAEHVSKLYDQRLYKGLPCFQNERAGTFTIGCILVHESFRRRGLARALLGGAIELAPRLGATALEAFPRSDESVPDGALMTGPTRLFLQAGFEVVHDFFPYPVLRRGVALPA